MIQVRSYILYLIALISFWVSAEKNDKSYFRVDSDLILHYRKVCCVGYPEIFTWLKESNKGSIYTFLIMDEQAIGLVAITPPPWISLGLKIDKQEVGHEYSSG